MVELEACYLLLHQCFLLFGRKMQHNTCERDVWENNENNNDIWEEYSEYVNIRSTQKMFLKCTFQK